MEDVEKVRKVLSSIDNFSFYTTQLQKSCDSQDNAELQLEECQDRFSKLKFNFVEMMTHKAFVDALKDFQLGQTPSCLVSETEATARREEMRALKDVNASHRSEIRGLCDQVASDYQTIQSQLSEIKAMMAEYEDAKASYDDVRTKLENQQSSDACQTYASVEDARADVERLQKELDTVQSEIAAAEQEAAETTSRADAIDKQNQDCLESLHKDKQTLRELVSNQDEEVKAEMKRLEQRRDDLQRLSGITIKNVSDSHIDAVVTLPDNIPHPLTLLFDTQSGRLVDIQLSRDEPQLKAMFQEAIQANDPAAAVRGIKMFFATGHL